MSTPAMGAAPSVDLFAAEMLVDPYPTYAWLRANRSVEYRSPSTPERHFLVLSPNSDVQLALRDPRFGRACCGDRLSANLGDGPLSRSFGLWMLFQDPPDHAQLRRAINQAFTPRAIDGLRDQVRGPVVELLDRLEQRPRFDLIAEFAAPLPVLVICALLAVPVEDRHLFADWSTALAASLDHLMSPEPAALQRADVGAACLTDYFSELVARRRATPRNHRA